MAEKMAKDRNTAVYVKDLVGRLDGETLRDVADLELKIEGGGRGW